MAEARATTIRFSEAMYRRLEDAGEVTGLPINSIVVVACLEWLDAHQPEREPPLPAPLSRPLTGPTGILPRGFRRAMYPFDRFTPRAKSVLTMTQKEAEAAGQGHIGDEHLLLGLLQETDSLANLALGTLGVELEKVRQEVNNALASRKPSGPERVGVPTSNVKRIIEHAFNQAAERGQTHVGTGELLVALVAEKDTVARTVLTNLGATPDQVRAEVERRWRESASD